MVYYTDASEQGLCHVFPCRKHRFRGRRRCLPVHGYAPAYNPSGYSCHSSVSSAACNGNWRQMVYPPVCLRRFRRFRRRRCQGGIQRLFHSRHVGSDFRQGRSGHVQALFFIRYSPALRGSVSGSSCSVRSTRRRKGCVRSCLHLRQCHPYLRPAYFYKAGSEVYAVRK